MVKVIFFACNAQSMRWIKMKLSRVELNTDRIACHLEPFQSPEHYVTNEIYLCRELSNLSTA